MLDCTKIDSLMMDWLYEELDESTTATFDQHVAGCAHCEGELASLQRTRSALKGLPEVEPPLALSNILLHEAAKSAPVSTAKGPLDERDGLFTRFVAWFGPVLRHPGLAAAACLVLVAGVAGSLYMQGKGGYAGPTAETRAPAPTDVSAGTAPDMATDKMADTSQPPGNTENADPDKPKLDNTGLTDETAKNEKDSEEDDKTVETERPDDDMDRVARLGDDSKELKKARDQLASLKQRTGRGNSGSKGNKDIKADGKLGLKSQDGFLKNRNRGPGQGRRVALAREKKPATKGWGKSKSPRTERARRRNAPMSKTVVTNAVTGADKLVHRGGVKQDPSSGGGSTADIRDSKRKRLLESPKTRASRTPAAPPKPVVGGVTGKFRYTTPAKKPPTTTSVTKPSPRKVTKKSGYAQQRVTSTQSQQPAYRAYKVSPRVQIWTQKQHTRLNSAVGSKKCLQAARIANDILDRNPNYYYKRVGPTKQVKVCRWYVNKEWNRRAKSRSRRAKARRPKRSKSKVGGVPSKAKAAPAKDEAVSVE